MSKENQKFVNNRMIYKQRPPLHQVYEVKNLDTISQILQNKVCKVERRQNGEYFRFDFKQTISDRVKFLQNQQCDDDFTEIFKQQYRVGSKIGQGAYATVRIGIQIATNTRVAIKIYEKSKIKDQQRRKGVKREIELLEKLNHRNIVKIIDTVESNNHVNIILEYVGGQSLHQLLKKQPVLFYFFNILLFYFFYLKERRLDEDTAKHIFRQIVQSVQYCHTKSIAHRDIKLENILLDGLTPKLIDFGFSTSFPIDKKVKMFCGTPSYMAPEIVSRQEYRGDKADVWALGVVLFTLLQGYFPFKGQTDQELYSKIQTGDIHMNFDLSLDAQDLISDMLTVDPDDRPLASDILTHTWFNLEEEPKSHSQTRKHKLPDDLLDDFNAITKNMSYITPTNQGKQFQFDFTLVKAKQTKPVIPTQQFFTTTNAQTKHLEPQFFKVDKLLQNKERNQTFSRERQGSKEKSKERQSSFSFESSRGLSQKKPHQLTIYPSFQPSDKSFGSVKSPSMKENTKRQFNLFFN